MYLAVLYGTAKVLHRSYMAFQEADSNKPQLWFMFR